MAEFAVFAYGMLTTFVLSGASRNRKLAIPHPPILIYVGYVLCGVSSGLSLWLFAKALRMWWGA